MNQSLTKPFQIDAPLSSLKVRHPDPDTLKSIISGSTRRGREIFVRLWLTEGEPFAFRECPGIFEEMRGWLALRLQLHPKEFTLVGSARTGYSLAPEPKYGTPFSADSDLDLATVSGTLFQEIYGEFQNFCDDYQSNLIAPRSEFERRCWDENLEFGRMNCPKGFFDANKLPNLPRYKQSQRINQTMWALCKKLESTPDAPQPKRASLRIYRDWSALINRVSLNLKWALG